MILPESVFSNLPLPVRNKLDEFEEVVLLAREISDPRVMRSLGPAAVRGLVQKRGKTSPVTEMPASHAAHFNWTYPADNTEMQDLYRRAKAGQWDGDKDLPWQTDVDPQNPGVRLLPPDFLCFEALREHGIRLDKDEELSLSYSVCSWMLSQFLHGEQGALFAAAQVTEAVQFFDGKLYGATQVMDEGRHVEVFSRYLKTKLNKLYQINDNLFVIIDALMTDSRWDMKFLGMQIMVEGLALGAFSTLYKMTQEPLLKQLLMRVIQDEARHVHYGVVALREHITNELSERERQEREDWAFEVAMLMRNRFMAYEVFDEWFAGRLDRAAWRDAVSRSRGMEEFRITMFRRLVPNLRDIGLLSPRILPAYERVGLTRYMQGKSAAQISEEQMVSELSVTEVAAR